MKDVAPDFEIVKLHPDHLDAVYNMYTENNSFWDDNIGKQILSAERDYSYEDFLNILQDDKVFGFILNERIPVQEFNEYVGYYNNDVVYIPILKGFLVYEIINNAGSPVKYNVLFAETEDKNASFYKNLLDYLKKRLREGKKCQRIEIELFDEDNSYYKMKAFLNNQFKEKNLVKAKKGPDSFIFEFIQRSDSESS